MKFYLLGCTELSRENRAKQKWKRWKRQWKKYAKFYQMSNSFVVSNRTCTVYAFFIMWWFNDDIIYKMQPLCGVIRIVIVSFGNQHICLKHIVSNTRLVRKTAFFVKHVLLCAVIENEA